MKRFLIFPLLMLTMFVSACGARATPIPTIDPVAIQNTSAAVAFTMVAQTQAALPTATPLPPTSTPTNTPAATSTFPPLPSLEVTFTSGPTENAAGDDPCVNKPLPPTLQGETVRVRINNSTKASLAVSIYLNSTETQSQCGYRVYTLAPEEPLVLNNLVEGCYTLWAWNPDPQGYFIVTNGTTCIDDSEVWVFDISTGTIRVRT